MTFEIEINGRMRRASVERSGPGRFLVTLDGVVHDVDASRTGEHALSLLMDGVSREVQLAPNGLPGELIAGLEGRTAGVSVNARRTRRGPADTDSGAGEQRIVAPMPGRVVRILAAPGDLVAARQSVIVVEAMKMENELRAARAGRVTHVAVTPGMSVESGRVLLVIE